MTVNGRDYEVLSLLGKGKGGYSYLVTDGAERFVLKQIHHEPCSYYQFGDKLASERRDYRTLKDAGLRMPVLLDVDTENERLLKEYIEGPTVSEVVRNGSVSDGCFRQVREMSALLKNIGLNIDWYPTNFVIHDSLLYYIDYECNEYSDTWSFETWGVGYWTGEKEIG